MFADVPLWVLFVIILIFFSGYMAFRAMAAERKLEQEFIEQEGKIYLERIEKEREERAKKRQQARSE